MQLEANAIRPKPKTYSGFLFLIRGGSPNPPPVALRGSGACLGDTRPRGQMKERTDSLGLLFIPCVGPGYDDTRIRPGNASYRRDREDGAYYERMFQTAIEADPPIIAITSFNEWHEGTQIEPSIPFEGSSFVFDDFRPLESDAYLRQTRALVDRYKKAGRPAKAEDSRRARTIP